MKDFFVNLKPEDAQYLFLEHGDMLSNVDWWTIVQTPVSREHLP